MDNKEELKLQESIKKIDSRRAVKFCPKCLLSTETNYHYSNCRNKKDEDKEGVTEVTPRKEELKKQVKIDEIKKKIADNEKFFEATRGNRVWKTEYSIGSPQNSTKCDIHEITDTPDGVHRKPEVFAELIRDKVKEEMWFCPFHNKMFFDIKDKAKKEIKRLEKRLNKIKYPDRLFI